MKKLMLAALIVSMGSLYANLQVPEYEAYLTQAITTHNSDVAKQLVAGLFQRAQTSADVTVQELDAAIQMLDRMNRLALTKAEGDVAKFILQALTQLKTLRAAK